MHLRINQQQIKKILTHFFKRFIERAGGIDFCGKGAFGVQTFFEENGRLGMAVDHENRKHTVWGHVHLFFAGFYELATASRIPIKLFGY